MFIATHSAMIKCSRQTELNSVIKSTLYLKETILGHPERVLICDLIRRTLYHQVNIMYKRKVNVIWNMMVYANKVSYFNVECNLERAWTT